MESSGDKFASLLIPNSQRTVAQEEKLQSCPFAREPSEDVLIPSSSSTDESPEQPTGIEMVSLPDSFDEYQTPPEQPYSPDSFNDGDVGATKTPAFDGEPQRQRIVDLADVSDNLDTGPMDVDDGVDDKLVTEGFDTEVISSPESAHQVFDEMPHLEQETSDREKLKLPILMETQNRVLKHETFKDALNRVLKMVGEGKIRGGDEDDDVDFMDTAKMRGLTFPRPRWWPAEGFKD